MVCEQAHLPVLWPSLFVKDDYFGVRANDIDHRAGKRWLVRASTPWETAYDRLLSLWKHMEPDPWSRTLFGFVPSLLKASEDIAHDMLVLDVADLDRTRPPGQMANQLIACSERFQATKHLGMTPETLATCHPKLTGTVSTDVRRIECWQRLRAPTSSTHTQEAVVDWAVGRSWCHSWDWTLRQAEQNPALERQVQRFCIYLSDQELTRGQPRPSGRSMLAVALASRDPVFIEERVELLINWGQLEEDVAWPNRRRIQLAFDAFLRSTER